MSEPSIALALEAAHRAVQKDPLALFTNFQWFLFAGKDTIFFTAFSRERFDKEKLKNLVAGIEATARELDKVFGLGTVRHAADIVWRRTKLGLRLTTEQIATLDAYMIEAQGSEAKDGAQSPSEMRV